jgi:mRNA-degrading endonuclease toxin of MazEF toxin-antitoxin module
MGGPSGVEAPQSEAVRQYELWWAQLPAPIGRCPVLLLTRTPAYAYLNKAIVAEVTRTIRGIPQEIEVGRREGLPARSVVNMDNVHVVPMRQLAERIGRLETGREAEVKRAVGYALDWAELKIL